MDTYTNCLRLFAGVCEYYKQEGMSCSIYDKENGYCGCNDRQGYTCEPTGELMNESLPYDAQPHACMRPLLDSRK